MANDTIITVVGSLTADPDLRFTPSGQEVVNFTVASNPRFFDKNTNEWKDGEALFMRCNAWKNAGAEHIAETFLRGMRVIVIGRLVQRNWEDKESGAKRSAMECTVDECGPSLKFATAKVSKVERSGDSGGAQQPRSRPAAVEDPWGSAPAMDEKAAKREALKVQMAALDEAEPPF